MLGDTNLNDINEVEILRRSVAMLQTGAAIFNREDALKLLAALKRRLDDGG